MFGYITPIKQELKVREYEVFRSYYCSVCKSIGKRYGFLPRLTLSYDATFLALLLSSLEQSKIDYKKERCFAHPGRKRDIIRPNPVIEYAADMNVVLAYNNLMDKIQDGQSLLPYAGKLLLQSSYKKLKKKYARKCELIESRLNELYQLEKEKCNCIDAAAEPFAKLMETIVLCETISGDEDKNAALKKIGYNIGKWIYVLDAFDDIDSDIKNNNYNPIFYQYELSNQDPNEFKARVKDRVKFTLTYTLAQISKACESLEIGSNSGLIENIIYMGMPMKTEQVLGSECNKECRTQNHRVKK